MSFIEKDTCFVRQKTGNKNDQEYDKSVSINMKEEKRKI